MQFRRWNSEPTPNARSYPARIGAIVFLLGAFFALPCSAFQFDYEGYDEGAEILPLPQGAGANDYGWGDYGDSYLDPEFGVATPELEEQNVFRLGTVDQWFALEEWDASFEAGVNGSDGNSDTFNLHTGFEFNRKSDLSESLIRFRYNANYADSVETQNNALLQTRHEWLFPDTPWSAFVNGDVLYDQFKAFDVRLVMNAGVGYTHIKTETTTFKSRYGAGVSREIGGPDNRWTPEALFGLDFTRQLTDRQKLNATVDYFPQWGDFRDYRLVSNFNWELLVDEEANLSLKLNVTDQYDSTPNGVEPHDINYALLLLWKL